MKNKSKIFTPVITFMVGLFAAALAIADTLQTDLRFHVYRVGDGNVRTELFNRPVDEPNSLEGYMPSPYKQALTAANALYEDDRTLLISILQSGPELRTALSAADALDDWTRPILALQLETELKTEARSASAGIPPFSSRLPGIDPNTLTFTAAAFSNVAPDSDPGSSEAITGSDTRIQLTAE